MRVESRAYATRSCVWRLVCEGYGCVGAMCGGGSAKCRGDIREEGW